jgi:protein O-mannosyl-transferase
LSGEAGPFGRPLSLATFLLNAASWPSALPDLFYTNTLIHLLNGVLLAWLVLVTMRVVRPSSTSNEWIALAVAAAWLCQPLLLSTSLILIQRMTSLTATITFASLIAFVHGRTHCERSPYVAALLMSLGIGVGTIMGVLTKETAILLPAYAWVLEATLLAQSQPIKLKWYRVWKLIFFALPLLLFVAYFCYSLPILLEGYRTRDFTLTERLLTEPRVLVDYLRLILLPARSALGPFHDDYTISRQLFESSATLAAIAFWTVALIVAVGIRKKVPVLTFAILWFVVGHSIEAGAIPLEIYFEHRNYLPAVGPIFALVYLVWAVPESYRRTAVTLFGVWTALVSFVLLETVRVWGTPLIAAEIWAHENPKSERAVLFLSQSYLVDGDVHTAYRVVADAASIHPHHISFALRRLHLSCLVDDSKRTRSIFSETLPTVSSGKFSLGAMDALQQLADATFATQCKHIKQSDIQTVAANLLANPNIDNLRRARYVIHHIQARSYTTTRNLSQTIYHLEAALGQAPAAESLLETRLLLAGTFSSAGLYKEALQTLDELEWAIQHRPTMRARWQTQIDGLRDHLRRQL